ncbi:DinB family protein [Terrimonas pollutisoli]|uniref:DinB family protein n=1 Tax=Terrimonas pollutisoli TaxID=3034147 RepID=UPI0023EA9AF5|nr:DinB family protein [Terrimonas sp. H1YJ31]
MQKYKSTELLDQLQADVRKLILTATYFKTIDPAVLLQQPLPGKWSIIEVLEHLNSYSRYYLLAIEKSLLADKPATELFKPGWLGDYFTKLMKPNEDGTVANKMKSPKDHRPPKFLDAFPVLNSFLEHQHYLLELLEQAKSKNIGSIRISITISKFIKLKLGDTFRFLIAHEQRHFVQIENNLEALKQVSSNKCPAILPVM